MSFSASTTWPRMPEAVCHETAFSFSFEITGAVVSSSATPVGAGVVMPGAAVGVGLTVGRGEAVADLLRDVERERSERLRAQARAEQLEEERARLEAEHRRAEEEAAALREELEAERGKGFWRRLFGG